MSFQLPRVSAFPILPEGHLIYKVSDALSNPAKVRDSHPLIGKQAPEVILQDQLGRDCSLHATIELGRPIVLFFFPLAGSPHCTLESCYFRDALVESAVFADLDAIVIGVSQDTPEVLRKFVKKYKLSYVVLSDVKKTAMESFQVSRTWLGLVNQRATFIIDPTGVVRGMCEGVMSASGHKNFAEKWLIRIEHEMADRAREVDETGTPSDTPRVPMASLEASSTRVKYGAENSAAGAGIDRAPRFGANPLTPPTLLSLKEQKSRGAQPNGSHSMNRNFASDESQQTRGSSNSSNSLGRTASKGGRRSLKNVFSRKSPPPVPPTYRNFDSTWQTYGTVEVEPPRSADHSPRASGIGSSHLGSWDLRSQGPSLSEPSMGSRTRPTTSSSHGSILADGAATKQSQSNGRSTPSYTVSHNMSKSVSESAYLNGNRARTPPRRSRDAPSDVPEDADEDEATEDFVTQMSGGAMDLTPRKRTDKALASYDASQPNGRMGLGALPPGDALASARADFQTQVPQPPSRTTSRNLPRPVTRPLSARPPSLETVQSVGSIARPSTRDGYSSSTENSGPKALSPRPTHSRPKASTTVNRVRSEDMKSSEKRTGAQTPPSRDSLDELDGAQLHSAKRFTIQAEPASPRRMSRVSSGAGSTRQSPAVGSSSTFAGKSAEMTKSRSREASHEIKDANLGASSKRLSSGSTTGSLLRKAGSTATPQDTFPAPLTDRVTSGSSSNQGHSSAGPSPRTTDTGAASFSRRPSNGSSRAASRTQRRSSALSSAAGEWQASEERRPSATSTSSARSAASAGTFGR